MSGPVRPPDFIHGHLTNVTTPQHWTSWSVVLQELGCVKLPSGAGRSPYIWPVFVWFDDFTKTMPLRVGVTGPSMQYVAAPLAPNMHVNDVVPIPARVGNVGTYTFEDSDPANPVPYSIGHNLVLVVALFEHHDFEDAVIAAGYTIFQSSLQAAFAQHLSALALATAQGDTTGLSSIKQSIQDQVNQDVSEALSNALAAHGTFNIFGLDVEGAINLGPGFKPDKSVESQETSFHEVQSTSAINLQFSNSKTKSEYAIVGQLRVGAPAASPGLPFDCASGGPFPTVNKGSLSGAKIPQDVEDGDVTLDNVSESKLGLTSRHGGITIAHKVDQHSSVLLTSCKGVTIHEKIDNHSHATIVSRGDVTIKEKIDQHSTADINSQGSIEIGEKIDQHSVAKLTAGTTVHIGKKIDQHSTAAIIAEGDINIDEGIDQHSTAFITSVNGSITIGKAVDGNSVVTLRAPKGTITIKQKVAGGATVYWSSPNHLKCPHPNGRKVKQLVAFPPLP